MKTEIREFKNYFKGYLDYYFNEKDDLNIQFIEEGDLLTCIGQVGDNVIEVQWPKKLVDQKLELTSIIKIQIENYSGFENIHYLRYDYQVKKIDNEAFFGKKGTIQWENLPYALDNLINDYICLRVYTRRGVNRMKRESYLWSCPTSKKAVQRTNRISHESHHIFMNKHLYFEILTDDEFQKHNAGTKYCFNKEGRFIGFDLEVPPGVNVIIKPSKNSTLLDMSDLLHQEHDDQTRLLNADLGEFLADGDLIEDMDFEEAQNYYSRQTQTTDANEMIRNKEHEDAQSISKLKITCLNYLITIIGEEETERLFITSRNGILYFQLINDESELTMTIQIFDEFYKIEATAKVWNEPKLTSTLLIQESTPGWIFFDEDHPIELYFYKALQRGIGTYAKDKLNSHFLKIVYDYKSLLDLQKESHIGINCKTFDQQLSKLDREATQLYLAREKVSEHIYHNGFPNTGTNSEYYFNKDANFLGSNPENKIIYENVVKIKSGSPDDLKHALWIQYSGCCYDLDWLKEDINTFYGSYWSENEDQEKFKELFYPEVVAFLKRHPS